ncbi:uncharacterized protein LOC111269190 isoform X2 [Varroa jacobsoni]|uniref:uncharacterized protein LOC111269190 isoform X2 n=1 Tax=Varroa jacobsoni TaxID=62625 RepID=UPI000BFAA95D|nr:uncharacterized protein LOC111269190 isoform X2 [Varroa jacobsoni]
MMRCVFSVASSRTPNAPEAYKLRNCYSRETLLPDANMSDDTTEIALTEAGDQLATITTGHTIKRRPFRKNGICRFVATMAAQCDKNLSI